eukprot:TRINITY_DN10476_c0_g1_i1.p1 TRINITY_DN10476_c0_g1~~TRINITY_DN10476_c0_g1_i1.p1  ORF type:complete len:827 (+),score=85.73 TRINITY_DN10476_c0_g1_i1:63-2543(+)
MPLAKIGELMSWLVLDHFREYNKWPWKPIGSVQKQIEEHPSFLVAEVGFIGLACLAFYHAFLCKAAEEGCSARRLKLYFVASVVAGTVNDYIFMILPVVDNFFQAQAVIMLTPRMPLYIPCAYITFMYWPTVAASRLFRDIHRHAVAEACTAGILAGLFYAPYDLCGARFLWWTWHSSDPAIAERWLGVPAGSTAWTITFVFCFSFLLRKSENMSNLASLALTSCFSTLLMVVLMNVFTLLGGDLVGRPGINTVLASLCCFGCLVLRQLVEPQSLSVPKEVNTNTEKRFGASSREPLSIRIGVFLYFLTHAIVMATFSPETQVSTGVHQTFGPCEETDIDLMGYMRYRYICEKRFPTSYFSFDCQAHASTTPGRERVSPIATTAELESATVGWYTVCGQPHGDFLRLMGAVALLTSLGALAFIGIFSFTGFRVGVQNSTGGRKKITPIGHKIKTLLDPIIIPLAEKHPNIAVMIVSLLFCGLIFFTGALLDVIYPAGTPGTYLQKPWDILKSLPGAEKPAFMFIFSGLVDLVLTVTYLILDRWRPPFVQRIMRQSRQPGDWDKGFLRTLWQTFKCFLFPTVVMTVQGFRKGPSFFTKPWMPTCWANCENELPELAPSLAEFIIHVAFCLLMFDVSYFYLHWQLHRHRSLYKHIHALHHEYKQPFITVASHVHVVEFGAIFLFSTFPPAACGAHPLSAIVFHVIQTIVGIEDHVGWYETPTGWIMDKLTLGNFGGSMAHNLHHRVVWGNYSPIFNYLDRLCGLDVEEDEGLNSRVPEFNSGQDKDFGSTKECSPEVSKMDVAAEIPRKVENLSQRRPRSATPPPIAH